MRKCKKWTGPNRTSRYARAAPELPSLKLIIQSFYVATSTIINYTMVLISVYIYIIMLLVEKTLLFTKFNIKFYRKDLLQKYDHRKTSIKSYKMSLAIDRADFGFNELWAKPCRSTIE